jgi:drug/metabolite transporter (DMT)-like permease
MGLSGLLVGGAHFILIERFRWAEAALLAPFKYVSMIWAVIFGFVIFGDLPDTWTWAGASFVVVCGLYIAHRENQITK